MLAIDMEFVTNVTFFTPLTELAIDCMDTPASKATTLPSCIIDDARIPIVNFCC